MSSVMFHGPANNFPGFVCGLVPMLFVSYVASPFVAHIHLRLPSYVRYSQTVLQRYTRTLPPDATLEFTTMNSIGVPRITPVKISDIRPVRQRLGMVNYATVKVDDGPRTWWMANVRLFGVHGEDKTKSQKEVWENIVNGIERRRN